MRALVFAELALAGDDARATPVPPETAASRLALQKSSLGVIVSSFRVRAPVSQLAEQLPAVGDAALSQLVRGSSDV